MNGEGAVFFSFFIFRTLFLSHFSFHFIFLVIVFYFSNTLFVYLFTDVFTCIYCVCLYKIFVVVCFVYFVLIFCTMRSSAPLYARS
jgi:hypothetical protein